VRWKKVALIGVGLLGGSLGMALRKRKLAKRVVGFVRRPQSLRECERAGAVDEGTTDFASAIKGADLIIFCTPLSGMRVQAKQLKGLIEPGAVVTDVGSVKGSVVRELEALVARAGGAFVGSHPMAGAEKSGVSAARPDLFQDAVCVVTPTRKTDRAALGKVERLWRDIGSCVLRLSPAQHDEMVSRTSHLPHLVAAGLAHRVLDPTAPRQQSQLCANGFRDTTRIASGSPEMWRDIAMANRASIGRALRNFIRDLENIRTLVARGNAKEIERFLVKAKQRRDSWRNNIHIQPRSPE
jgi:prephenate dehydrogenase